jgi:hypothetical protein
MKWPKFKGPILLKFRTVSLIPISIFAIKALEIIFRFYGIEITRYTADGENTFISNFIEWFGVLYGILLPLILVRVWEQLDDIDREFDREADTIKMLYEDVFYLQGKNVTFGKEIAELLRGYVEYVIGNYRYEIKPDAKPKRKKYQRIKGEGNLVKIRKDFKRFIQKTRRYLNKIVKFEKETLESSSQKRIAGDKILEKIRAQCKSLISSHIKTTDELDPFISEIFHRLNEIVDIRGDRIGLASQRLFGSLRTVALITSITFVLPFYFVGFTPETPILHNILIVCVTILVIFIYLIIEDFDEPFGGTWRITTDSWERVLEYMVSPERVNELKNLSES